MCSLFLVKSVRFFSTGLSTENFVKTTSHRPAANATVLWENDSRCNLMQTETKYCAHWLVSWPQYDVVVVVVVVADA